MKAVLLVELADLSGNHLLDDLLRLVCVLLVVLDLSDKDFPSRRRYQPEEQIPC